MGWSYMTSLNGHKTPRQYLDAQLTYETSQLTAKVLASALCNLRVYYAAVEHIAKETQKRDVFAAVCLVRYNPRDKEGYIFGYKDMNEDMGPCEEGCPGKILDLLTPTDQKNAIDWRARCRNNIAIRNQIRAKPSPRPGQTIIFADPLKFSDGATLKTFLVVPDPTTHRTVLFRDPATYSLYHIRNVKKRDYQLVNHLESAEATPAASGEASQR
jgi:hypothetical protein